MLLQDLTMGEDLTLEVLWGEFHYDISSKVEYVKKDGILITSFTYAGRTIDFNRPEFKGAVIDVYVNDPEGKRYCWKDVDIVIKSVFGKDFYMVRAHEFKKFALESERRQNDRILLNKNCNVIIEGSDTIHHVVLHDISSNGLAFLSDEDLKVGGKLIKVEFSDDVREHNFDVRLECRFVRKTPKDAQELFACRISEANREALAYLYLKTAEVHGKASVKKEPPVEGQTEPSNEEQQEAVNIEKVIEEA